MTIDFNCLFFPFKLISQLSITSCISLPISPKIASGPAFLIPSLILTLYYNVLCFKLYNFKKNKFDAKIAKSIFGYSILYLFLVFVLFLIDKII